jgi:hypothetical protein
MTNEIQATLVEHVAFYRHGNVVRLMPEFSTELRAATAGWGDI